jgi:hypothetical protein
MLEATVIAPVIKELATGQCTSHFTRNPPQSVNDLFEVTNGHMKSHVGGERRHETSLTKQASSVVIATHLAGQLVKCSPFTHHKLP